MIDFHVEARKYHREDHLFFEYDFGPNAFFIIVGRGNADHPNRYGVDYREYTVVGREDDVVFGVIYEPLTSFDVGSLHWKNSNAHKQRGVNFSLYKDIYRTYEIDMLVDKDENVVVSVIYDNISEEQELQKKDYIRSIVVSGG